MEANPQRPSALKRLLQGSAFVSYFPAPRDDAGGGFLDPGGEGAPAPACPGRRPWRSATTVLRILPDFCSPKDDCWPSACFQESVHGTPLSQSWTFVPVLFMSGTRGMSGCADGGKWELGCRPVVLPALRHLCCMCRLQVGSRWGPASSLRSPPAVSSWVSVPQPLMCPRAL